MHLKSRSLHCSAQFKTYYVAEGKPAGLWDCTCISMKI